MKRPLRVVIAVHGRFHAFDLARQLHLSKVGTTVITTYPRFAARRYLAKGIDIASAPWLEAARRLDGQRWLVTEAFIARRFGRFLARHLPQADVFVGWSGASLEAIPRARALGMKVVIERGSTHICHQSDVLQTAYEQFGIKTAPIDPEIIQRELAEYDAADAVAVPSRYAAGTFLARGFSKDKLIINSYGADLERFSPATPSLRGRAAKPRVLFVGAASIRKGLPWLLEAFGGLGDIADLDIVGPIEPALATLVAKAGFGVVCHGHLRSPALEAFYNNADIFCLPSIEEGFPMALLQAMAAGLPVVATDETGAADLVQDGREGILVPSRDSDSLRAALRALVLDAQRRSCMGQAARARIQYGNTWEDYGRRALAAYRALIGDKEPEGGGGTTASSTGQL